MPQPASNLSSLHALADDVVKRTKVRVTCIEWDGRKIWIKKPLGSGKGTFWHKLQNACATLIPLPILRPTVSMGGTRGLELEAKRINQFRHAGFIVPEVLGMSARWLILGDAGVTLERILKKDPDLNVQKLQHIVREAALTLATLHKNGLVHGRGKLNDMVQLQDGRIGFIDFEEDIESARIPLTALMARDVFLFVINVAKFTSTYPDICETAIETYKNNHNNAAVFAELHKLLRLLKPFRTLASPFRAKLKGEPREIYAGVTALLRAA